MIVDELIRLKLRDFNILALFLNSNNNISYGIENHFRQTFYKGV